MSNDLGAGGMENVPCQYLGDLSVSFTPEADIWTCGLLKRNRDSQVQEED